MKELYRQAVKNAQEKKYRQDFTVMKQIVKDPEPVKIPKEQKKKSLMEPLEKDPPKKPNNKKKF